MKPRAALPLAAPPRQGSAAKPRRPGFAGSALASPLPKRPADRVFKEKTRRRIRMKRIAFAARVAIEVLLLVAAIVMILALPGLLDDTSSTVPQASTREAGR
jgi:hypothetical protein